MDSRTRKRMLAVSDHMAMMSRRRDFSDEFPAGEGAAPIVVALKTDSVGEILDRISAIRTDSGPTSICVIVRAGRKKFYRCDVSPSDTDSLSAHREDFPVPMDAEWGMLLDYLTTQAEPVSFHAVAPGFAFAVAMAATTG